ncbi:MAG: transcription termination/antitermination protein NusA [Bacilli bacterium]|nr:transcription termination/antitermination protein NusA [Bacilli bacterium]
MDNKEFKRAVDLLVKEKGINPEVIYEALELALTSAYKKNYNSLSNVRIDINRETGEVKVYSYKTVVDRNEEDKYKKFSDIDFSTINEEDDEDEPVLPFVYDEKIHLTLEEARKIVPDIKIGETIEEEVTPKDFGRVAASTAKQVVIQKIREAERNVIIEEFSDKEEELATGIVAMEDERNYYIDLGRTQGILPKSEIIPGENIKMGSSIKVYITKVENNSKGPLILLSRTHYGFVKRLFELEIPEVNEGIILIYSVARDAGNRTKIAVYSEDPNVDPVGSCIGERGSRINNIIKELNGEKVDIIPYDKDATKFIENALSPARNLHVFITNEEKKEAYVIVDDDNLSLAIGKKGSNVRLAARLTHYKIDVKSYDQAREDGINILGD